MKVVIANFTNEANANVPHLADLNNFDLGYGDEVAVKMHVKELFDEAGVEVIPALYANSGSAGVICEEAFTYIESRMLRTVKEHLGEIDGFYLQFHGASQVENGIGSGDFHIVREIRKVVGPYVPIAVVCDPHGNLSQEYINDVQIIRSYRESPHTDAIETGHIVAKMLIDLMKSRQNIHPSYRKMPLILGGEQSVSADEPVCTINRFMDEMEKDPRVRSASWHVGYIRHDCWEAGCSVVVVPETEADQEYCETKVDELYDFVWERRHEFHYTGYTAEPEEALKEALAFEGKPVFITDSGDNSTSGSTGWNTFVLRQVLAVENLEKKVLFASICDPKNHAVLDKLEIGETATINLGMNYDELSTAVPMTVKVKAKGPITGFMMFDHSRAYANCVTVDVVGTPVSIVVADDPYTLCEHEQYVNAGIDWDEYDIIVVKQGYIFPELKAKGALSIMSLTNGPTLQNTAILPFKRIMRPMFPIDKI